jgi:hypothetical protein
MTDSQLLKFSTGNGKLKNRLIFSLPAGYTCPHAGVCKTLADRKTGKLTDLPQMTGTEAPEFSCFAACSEKYPVVRNVRWHNFELLRACDFSDYTELAALIFNSLMAAPKKDLVRIHESGDFWTEIYMRAWIDVARLLPDITMYAYTKSLGMWQSLYDYIPDNFYLTASYGGTLDYMIPREPKIFKRYSRVVYTEQEAADLGLEIDHDDSHCLGDKPFALLVHGTQRAGSEASKALSQRKKEGGFVGYGKSNSH